MKHDWIRYDDQNPPAKHTAIWVVSCMSYNDTMDGRRLSLVYYDEEEECYLNCLDGSKHDRMIYHYMYADVPCDYPHPNF